MMRYVVECWYRHDDLDEWHLATASGSDILETLADRLDWLTSPHRQVRVQRLNPPGAAGEGRDGA